MKRRAFTRRSLLKKKAVGRYYVKIEPTERSCVVCATIFMSAHPTQKTCLHPDCKETLKKRNFENFIMRQAQKFTIENATKLAKQIIVKQALREAEEIVRKRTTN